ncbi:ChrR family anti-sigma-E factor [Kordiimonas aestuarii]|uniref:ChrR family anti-sigma-E factor n=1 Tax=Kordiimonas aestuarii TaxID=1005925 RepID=UPI0021CFF5E7|nr:ChrR family anti-sigma-E factor [Kordiimonas aestuarii]
MTKTGLLPDEWLVSYASGALSEAQALVVASHVDYHEELKAKVADAEAIGGCLLEGIVPERLSEDALERTLAALAVLDDAAEALVEPVGSSVADIRMPAPLAAHLNMGLDELKWRFMGPGMRQVKLQAYENGERLWLLRARGGTEMPFHDHRGTEFTLVLTGSYRVGDKHYTPGLIELAGPEVTNHQPIIDEGEDCICLVVTDAPIKLHSLIGRMFQPFIGL